MSEETSFTNEKDNQQRHVSEAFRKMLLIGIGTAMLAQEEGEAFVKKLRDRGEKAEARGRKRIREVHDQRRQKAEKVLEKRIDQVLQHMDIPTKADYLDLSEKISELSKKLDGD
jgi:polyhydroxyalkanoate synthesis regulator phasin